METRGLDLSTYLVDKHNGASYAQLQDIKKQAQSGAQVSRLLEPMRSTHLTHA